MSGEYLFVYGSLRRGSPGGRHDLLEGCSEFVGAGAFQGRLFLAGAYPGAVPSEDPADRVLGEVFLLCEPDAVLPRLDRYEGCGTGLAEPPEYVRCREPILLGDGRRVQAWIFIYNRATAGLPRIASGNFLEGER